MNNTPDSPAKPPDDRMDQGGNYWTLFNPGVWKVLHAVLQFWVLVSDWISPANKAAAIAAVNSLANVSGFVAPFLFGFIKDQTGSFALGLLPMIVLALIGAAPLFS